MIEYEREPDSWIESPTGPIACFATGAGANIDSVTVASFGEEWAKFAEFSQEEIERIGDEYFDVVTAEMLTPGSAVLDLGCGSGRWSTYVSSRCGFIEAVDPSASVLAAQATTRDVGNVRVTQASVDTLPFADETFDFILCLGALHHIPDTADALRAAVKKLKVDGWILIYIYYALENRGRAHRALFRLSDLIRRVVSRLPGWIKRVTCDFLAVVAYAPLVLFAKGVGFVFGGHRAETLPLHYYADKSWRVMRNDSLDRFGTPLEQRFTRDETARMMRDAGLVDLQFSEHMPMWHAVGRRGRP